MELQQLYKTLRANNAVDFITLLEMVRDVISDIRKPITGLTPEKDTAEMRLAIIRVVDQLLLNPLKNDVQNTQIHPEDNEFL